MKPLSHYKAQLEDIRDEFRLATRTEERIALIHAMEDVRDIIDVLEWNIGIIGVKNERAKSMETKVKPQEKKKQSDWLIILFIAALTAICFFMMAGCGTVEGIRSDIHKLTEPQPLSSQAAAQH